jgi:hypothetical protein
VDVSQATPIDSVPELDRWLREHGADERELIVAVYKKSSGKQTVTFDELLETALCHGWVDTQTKGIDDERYAIRWVPRRPGSSWSARNHETARRLIEEGRMEPAGEVVLPPDLRADQEAAMWTNEQSIETSAAPERIWRLWADVDGWPSWNGDIERIELIGPFAVGSRILMTPIGDEPVELRITEVAEPELFVDEADGGDFVVRTTHRAERIAPERTRVTYRMEITGAAADTIGPQIGPEISGDFPETLAGLVALAES